MPLLVLPATLAQLAGTPREIPADASTVGELLAEAARRFPALGRQLFDEAGELRRYLTVFRDDDDVRRLGGLATPLAGAEVVTVLPPIAGGRPEESAGARSGREAGARDGRGPRQSLLRHAEAAYPEEACGLVFAREGGVEVVALPNAAAAPRERFEIPADSLLAALARGGRLVAIYHSHADRGPALSAEDRQASELWPGVAMVVASVYGGRARQLRAEREGREVSLEALGLG